MMHHTPNSSRELERRQNHSVPSPLVGEGQGGGDGRTLEVGLPPTLTPPHKGEGNPLGAQPLAPGAEHGHDPARQ